MEVPSHYRTRQYDIAINPRICMSAPVARMLLLRTWTEATGRAVISPPEMQAVLALAGGIASESAGADMLRVLYSRPAIVSALEGGHMHDLAGALRLEGLTGAPREPLARALMQNASSAARSLGEPVRVMLARPDGPQPDRVLTADGWMRLEDEYLPRVVTRENGQAHAEALKVQAIAARTYLLRAMRDHRSLGRTAPIQNSERFQTYAARATPRAREATEATRGIVGRHRRALIIPNNGAGAHRHAEGAPRRDPTHTERFVTYNEGRTGDAVRPSHLASPARSDNRGCMSQNCADWLARQGRSCPSILRFFYGADLEIEAERSDSADDSTTASAAPLLALAGIVVALSS